MRRLLPALLLCALSCSSDMSVAKRERYFARTGSELALVEHYIERFNWAEAKSAEYAELVAQAEQKLGELRGQLRDLRQTNDKRAKEIAALQAETEKLGAETAERQAQLAAAQAAVQKIEAELAEKTARRQVLDQQAARLEGELGELETRHPEARLRIDRLKLWLRDGK